MLLQLLMRITFTQFSIFQNLPGVDIAHTTMFNMTCTAHMFVASFNNTRQNFCRTSGALLQDLRRPPSFPQLMPSRSSKRQAQTNDPSNTFGNWA